MLKLKAFLFLRKENGFSSGLKWDAWFVNTTCGVHAFTIVNFKY